MKVSRDLPGWVTTDVLDAIKAGLGPHFAFVTVSRAADPEYIHVYAHVYAHGDSFNVIAENAAHVPGLVAEFLRWKDWKAYGAPKKKRKSKLQ